MQREDVLGEALKLLELQGIANTTLEMVAERVDYPLDELRPERSPHNFPKT